MNFLSFQCQKPFVDKDIVILNAKDDDLTLMQSRMEVRQAEQKKKKEKKIKVKEEIPSTSTTDEDSKYKILVTPKPTLSVEGKIGSKRPGAIAAPQNSNAKKTKADYSVAKDPQVSDVYKSIFTSHKSEKEQNRAHWITYNPFYN